MNTLIPFNVFVLAHFVTCSNTLAALFSRCLTVLVRRGYS